MTEKSRTNYHAMSINEKQSNITDEYILEVVARHAIVRRS